MGRMTSKGINIIFVITTYQVLFVYDLFYNLSVPGTRSCGIANNHQNTTALCGLNLKINAKFGILFFPFQKINADFLKRQ